ncbi:hypothetical protein BDW59DRAFT_152013, partial [Aspergillus cavernicola]
EQPEAAAPVSSSAAPAESWYHEKPHYKGQGEEQPSEAHFLSQPEAPTPVEPGWTKVHQVVQTVTSTRIAVETHTVAVYPQQTPNSEFQRPCHQYPGVGTPFNGDNNQAQTPSSSQYPSKYSDNQSPGPSSNVESWYPNPEHGSLASPAAPAATPLFHESQDSQKSSAQPWAISAYHGAGGMTSSVAVNQEASSSMIPVFVPTGTPRGHASVVIASSSTPGASSVLRPMATDMSPENNQRPSSPYHGGMMFTGGSAGRVTPTAVLTVLSGICILLGFAL